jgi:histone deacetylase 6
VFVASDHHVWDPNRQRKLRKKYGNLKKSGQHSLSYMLQEHMEEVKELLLSKKKAGDSDHENGVRSIEEHQEVLRSPPLGIGGFTQTDNGADSRKASATPVRSPRMPAIGYFSASPHSPMKRNF